MFDKIKNQLIVSCQALPDEPLFGADFMAKMAIAAKQGGAAAIRSNSVTDIEAIKKATDLPIIGLIKEVYTNSDIYITPTKREVEALIKASCEMIAIDATMRKRNNDQNLKDLVDLIHKHGKLAMADISTVEEAKNAQNLGFDCVSTTLSGYTTYSRKCKGPDVKLIRECVANLTIPVIAEGRINDKCDLKKVLKEHPFAVVIGSAITRPQFITRNFVNIMKA